MKKILILLLFCNVSFTSAQDFNNYLSDAEKAFQSGMYRKAYDSATKAIDLNGTSSEARWFRIKSSLTANAPISYFKSAISDLSIILSQNPNDVNGYKYLAIAERELGSSIYRYKSGENYLTESQIHYNNAIKACETAIKLDPNLKEELQYKIKEFQREILRIKES